MSGSTRPDAVRPSPGVTEPSDAREALRRKPTLTFATDVLGWRLVRDADDAELDGKGRRSGRIVEVEAYIGEDDLASHARFGRTARNEVMYGPPGRAYVYLVYGMHDCLNIVTGPSGEPAAILVRAVEPLEGIDLMRAARTRRSTERRRPERTDEKADDNRAAIADWRVASGPGLVCAAFGLDRRLTGADLLDPRSPVRLEPPLPGEPRPAVMAGPRVGIDYAGSPWTEKPWRFAIAGNRAVSRPPLVVATTGRPSVG
jgi:DNA-3-methyladenine glycosylase